MIVDDQAKFLHPSSLLFQVLSTLRQSIFPIAVASWSAIKGNVFGIVLAVGILGILALFALIRYLTFRYRIADGELVVTEGLLFRKMRNVPVDRIQNVDLVQNLLHRLLKVAEVRVETASGTEPEATLRVLSMRDVEKLREQILGRTSVDPPPSESSDLAPTDTQVGQTRFARERLLKINTLWLVKAGLASNRGMIIVGILLGLYFQGYQGEDFDTEWISDSIPTQFTSVWVLAVLATIAFLVLIRLLGVAWYILRFHDYKLEQVGEDLHISCGLLTKVSATVPRRRIQFISLHQTPVLRWMKMASIRIETAGGAGKGNEDASSTVTRRWFVPVIPLDQVPGLIDHLRPGFDWVESTKEWATLSPRAGRRLSRLCIIAAIFAGLIGFVAQRPWGWTAGVICVPLFLWWGKLHLRYLGYSRAGQGVVFRSGVWTRKTSVTFFDRIQTVSLSESPFDRRWQMAKLSVDTAASGPADHTIEIGFLEASDAKAELQTLSQQSSEAGMQWN